MLPKLLKTLLLPCIIVVIVGIIFKVSHGQVNPHSKSFCGPHCCVGPANGQHQISKVMMNYVITPRVGNVLQKEDGYISLISATRPLQHYPA